MTPSYGPLSLLLASLLPVAGATAIHSAAVGAVALGVLVLAAPWAVRDWRSTLRRLSVGVLAGLVVGLSTWLYGGRDLDVALAAVFRVLYIIVPAAVLTPLIDPTALGDHLGQRTPLPDRVVVAASAALQRLESLGRQWEQISRARRARGVGADGGLVNRTRVTASMTVSLLVATMRMSGSMSLAMEARGFAGAQRRTWAEPAPWYWRDTAILAAGLGMALLPWLLRLTAVGSVAPVG